MAENDTRIIMTAFTLPPPILIHVDIWHMGNLNGAWKMDAFSVVSNVTGIVPVLTYHHAGYRCMRQISGNYRAHFNQSTWQAWNARGHPRLLRIIVGRMIISQGSRGWKPIAPFSGERASDRSSNTAKSHICHPYLPCIRPLSSKFLYSTARKSLSLSHLSTLRLSSISFQVSRTRYLLPIFSPFSTDSVNCRSSVEERKKKRKKKNKYIFILFFI